MIDVDSQEGWVLGDVLRRHASQRPTAPFLTFAFGETITYGEMLRRANAIAAGLHDLGVRHGHRVALLMENSAEFVVSWFAINLLGAVEAPVNCANRGRTLRHAFNNSAARVAIVDVGLTPHLADCVRELDALETVVVVGEAPPTLPWKAVAFSSILEKSGTPPEVLVSYRDPASIIYTSGTSGPAKGVLASHAHAYLLGAQTVDRLSITSDDVYYVCLPLFHSNAQWVQIYAALIAGAHVHVVSRFSASGWLEDVRRCGATVSSLLGVMAQFLYAQPESAEDRNHHLRRVVAIPLPPTLVGKFEDRFGIEPVEAYGMTEISLPIWRPRGDEPRAGSSGKPLEDLFEMRLVDPDTDAIVPRGEVGEIVVRPRYPWMITLGYNQMPELTVEAFRNLWFHTGDAARIDESGYWHFVDRIRDRIRRRGENVSSFDVEAALLDHPAVQECAAIAVPAPEGDDDIKAVVVTSVSVDPEELIDWCRRSLPYFAVPRYLEFVEAMPMTHNGKVLKRELRKVGLTGREWDREVAGVRVAREA